MEINSGIHFYINIKNLLELIKEENEIDDNLRRTIHRIHFYFYGLDKIVKHYGCKVEKLTGGRVHVVYEETEAEDIILSFKKVIKAIIACNLFVKDYFNNYGKYSGYTNLRLQSGADYGDYCWYEYNNYIDDSEDTTIGSVANIAAKAQTLGKSWEIIITKEFMNYLDEYKDKFVKIEANGLTGKASQREYYAADFRVIVNDKEFSKIVDIVKDISVTVKSKVDNLNISDIKFITNSEKIDFLDLNIRKNNVSTDCLICADVRGFSNLFNKSSNNLSELSDVIKEVLVIMQSKISSANGVRVQFQGDRIVAIFNDINIDKPYVLRALEAAMQINESIDQLNERQDINRALGSNRLSVGIGCAIGQIIASRVGLYNHDNIVLGHAVLDADIAEDRYSDENEIVVNKSIKDHLEAIINDQDSDFICEFEVVYESLNSIETTGYYSSSLTYSEYQSQVTNKKMNISTMENKADIIFQAPKIAVEQRNAKLRPWRR